ncbi:uncharacterized protein RAG0_12440 [Rhynchosporium agropyri]|uniref:Zn(2)-C6 fungal-type domain-containing protein n=2 Tax=Rhynchosporium TaxID=38037 RepID=A0A1E1L8G6_9HELO|nr:uncharacterized protein RAG0_12440 [Rhynchosporium agropyri]CZT07176.1 uncharacterized protein RCO7_09718 [Rhynchosporium commune]
MAPKSSPTINRTSSPPTTKKARIEKMPKKSKKQKKAKAKKGPACETCRKKHTKCAHRLELGSVTKPSSSTIPITATTPSSSSASTSAAVPAASNPAKSTKQEPSPAPKIVENGDATEAVRRRIWEDRQKYTIVFTEEDWYREPVWASRVFGGQPGAEEYLLYTTSARVEES